MVKAYEEATEEECTRGGTDGAETGSSTASGGPACGSALSQEGPSHFSNPPHQVGTEGRKEMFYLTMHSTHFI